LDLKLGSEFLDLEIEMRDNCVRRSILYFQTR